MTSFTIYDSKIPSTEDAIQIYCSLGWGKKEDYNTETWSKVFKNSKIITAYNDKQLVGVTRYLTDGYQDTQICEMAVCPAFQRQGIGKEMLRKLIELQGHTHIYITSTMNSKEFFLSNGLKSPETMTPLSRKAA